MRLFVFTGARVVSDLSQSEDLSASCQVKYDGRIEKLTVSDHLPKWSRTAILVCAFLGLLFDGFELGLMPVASLSVSKSLLGSEYTSVLGGEWFAKFTAALLLGAAIGGIVLGNLGDRIGRTRAMGVSILFYSLFAALGAWAQTQEQMLLLRFLVGLGVGGVWPNAITLVAECWPGASRPLVSGVMSAGLNAGILMLSQLARYYPITVDTWQWLFQLAGFPALLGVFVLVVLPESPAWLRSRRKRIELTTATKEPLMTAVDRNQLAPDAGVRSVPQSQSLWRAPLLQVTIIAVFVSSIPMLGAWSASKWMIPWADAIAGGVDSGYKAATQGWWALGATLGSFSGAQLAGWLGRRRSYFLMSIATTVLTIGMFQFTAPLQPLFHPVVFMQGFVATLFFGWLAVYLPELFPAEVRATGSGLAYNSGRFATATGVLIAGWLFAFLGGHYPTVGTICSLIYALGALVIWFAPEEQGRSLAA